MADQGPDIERSAEASIAKGVGFAILAILTTMAGLAGFPVLSLRTGAASCLMSWAILRLMAIRAPTLPYKRTETWLTLEPRPALPPLILQRLIGTARRASLERYARWSLLAAIGLWLASLVVSLALRVSAT